MQKSIPFSVVLAKDGKEGLRRNTEVGKTDQITGRRDSEQMCLENAKNGYGVAGHIC